MTINIPWTAPVQPAPTGLLNSPYWWTWLAYLIVLPMAWILMPGQLRGSVKALWAPVAAFLSRLSVLMEVLRVLVGGSNPYLPARAISAHEGTMNGNDEEI